MGELLLARSAIHQALYQLYQWLSSTDGCLFVEFAQHDEMSGFVSRLEGMAHELEGLENAINA